MNMETEGVKTHRRPSLPPKPSHAASPRVRLCITPTAKADQVRHTPTQRGTCLLITCHSRSWERAEHTRLGEPLHVRGTVERGRKKPDKNYIKKYSYYKI
ncbi:hypothetical protein E2C01_068669 [Portunus trituberculatus]|uniref:Uncharacterized protein n=1 Tax=Portunus trituberculatus TaxID=210409 RepID=A0A5B7HSL4_PORTR|nr:hypothetical protein [Portunus trituberculatus]